jgi:hypothetical protein
MRSLGLSEESVWVSSPGPDDAESWLGALVQDPLAGAIALLLLAVALALVTRSPAPAISARALTSPAAASNPRAFGGQLPVPSSPPTVSKQTEHRIKGAYGKLPLSFIENKGQMDRQIRYYAQGPGYSFFFTNHEVRLALTKGKREQVLDLRFLGARSNASLERGPPLPGRVSYISGRDSSKWHTNLRTFRSLRYRDLWPGIDMIFKGRAGRLSYEFIVRPGADPSDIRLAYQGANDLALSKRGDLLFKTPRGTFSDQRPRSFQRIARHRGALEVRFSLNRGSRGAFGFKLGRYDHGYPLVIGHAFDPTPLARSSTDP